MRTSRISRDTSKVLTSLSSRPTHSRPPQSHAALQAFAVASGNASAAPDVATPQAAPEVASDSELSSVPEDLDEEDGTPAREISRKRKRGEKTPAAGIARRGKATTTTTVSLNPKNLKAALEKQDIKADPDASPARGKPKKARRAPAKKIVGANGSVKVEPPVNWEEVYALTKRMRAAHVAPVDTMGCESLADVTRPPRDQRFQTLVALMLSSQTKDTVTAVAMKNLQENLPGGFNLESILAVDPPVLNGFIEKVGFHNNKTKYIKAAAEILRTSFNSDIPDTIKGLTSLPGVGPKMAYLCMSAAWGRDEGIGVDVHVHRITNLWGWHKTKTPEETRAALESWLPRDRWHDINNLLVGFGQTICLPVGRKCGECTLAEKGMCPSVVVGKATKVRKEKMAVVKEGDDSDVLVKEEVDIVEEHEIKAEDVEDKIPDIEDLGRSSSRRSRRLIP